jgi:hypothetical protein
MERRHVKSGGIPQMTTTILPTNETTAKLDMIEYVREGVCDENGCSNEASSFDTDRIMFLCQQHASRQEIERLRAQLAAQTEVKEAPETIEYTPYTMPLPDGLHPDYTVEVMAAGETGLGYVKCLDTYTIAHLPTQDLLIFDWFVESEELARQWIEQLVALADWTGTTPKFRDAECLKDMIAFACVGMLTEGNLSVSCISSTVA